MSKTIFCQTRIGVYLAHNPAGTSTRNMMHYAQMVHSGQHIPYDDYIPEANLKRYGVVSFFYVKLELNPGLFNKKNFRLLLKYAVASRNLLKQKPVETDLLNFQYFSLIHRRITSVTLWYQYIFTIVMLTGWQPVKTSKAIC